MRVLFIHQNFPGQFKHLAQHYAARSGNEVVFITQRSDGEIPGVRKAVYTNHREPTQGIHRYCKGFESAVIAGQSAARQALALREEGFVPDVIVAHPGWGEALYMKDVFPETPLLNYCEFFFHPVGADTGFDPEFQREPDVDEAAAVRTRNAPHLLNLEIADWGLTPTRWQWQQHPAAYRPKISVIHEGIDTQAMAPDPDARVTFGRGDVLGRDDEVVTFVARNLEPYRGFHIFMRAVERIARRRPRAHFVVIGGDETSYGQAPRDGRTYRERMLAEVDVDLSRVHFLGRVPRGQFRQVLQISSVHVYLTYPFVLSWSMLEAMACGCAVVGSATPPVEEVITDGHNGLLVDFFSPQHVADRVDEVLDHPDRMQRLREAARATIQDNYDLASVCLPRQLRLIDTLAAGGEADTLRAVAHAG